MGEQGFKLRSSCHQPSRSCHLTTRAPEKTNVHVAGPLILQLPFLLVGPLPLNHLETSAFQPLLHRSWISSFTARYQCSIATLQVFVFPHVFSLKLKGLCSKRQFWHLKGIKEEELFCSLRTTPGSHKTLCMCSFKYVCAIHHAQSSNVFWLTS